jgi:hypothetical protein
MADYYVKFACLLDVGSAQNAARAVAIREQLAAELKAAEDVSLGFEMVELNDRPSDGQLVLYSDDYGDTEHVILFVRRCAKQFGLTGKWGFCWSQGCSKPRVDAFGGGACLLDLSTGDVISDMTTGVWLEDAIDGAGALSAERAATAIDTGGPT